MTTFFTIMILTYATPEGEFRSGILYPSQQACGEALTYVYPTIERHYPDSMAQCVVTRQLSASARPKARPFKENNDD